MKSLLSPLISNPYVQGRETKAKFVEERIYGGVTVLAVNAGLLFKQNLTIGDAYIAVISTIGGLWLASLFASVVSYRIVHDTTMPRRDFIHELAVHRGLLFAAIPSMIMFSLAALELTTLRTAIIADICLAAIAMTITIARSGKTKRNTYVTALISIALQAVVAGLIILIKLGGES